MPLPAPARTRSGPPTVKTARRCSGLSRLPKALSKRARFALRNLAFVSCILNRTFTVLKMGFFIRKNYYLFLQEIIAGERGELSEGGSSISPAECKKSTFVKFVTPQKSGFQQFTMLEMPSGRKIKASDKAKLYFSVICQILSHFPSDFTFLRKSLKASELWLFCFVNITNTFSAFCRPSPSFSPAPWDWTQTS